MRFECGCTPNSYLFGVFWEREEDKQVGGQWIQGTKFEKKVPKLAAIYYLLFPFKGVSFLISKTPFLIDQIVPFSCRELEIISHFIQDKNAPALRLYYPSKASHWLYGSHRLSPSSGYLKAQIANSSNHPTIFSTTGINGGQNSHSMPHEKNTQNLGDMALL